jgi:hypothetical protein
MNTPQKWSESPIHEQIRTMYTDTPETDSHYYPDFEQGGDVVLADFARKLELERDEARETLAGLRASVLDLSHPNIKMILSERDEAREYADKLAEGLPDGMLPKDVEVLREANLSLATELAAVTEQRDQFESKLCIALRGHPDSELWGDAGLIAATMRCVDALDKVTEQRDRLAEALRELCIALLTPRTSTGRDSAPKTLSTNQ